MIHPSELLRANSGRQFSAPVNVVKENPIDCGIATLPCLSRCYNLEKLAKAKCFVCVLGVVGLLQGILVTYFRGTAPIWAKHYNITQENIEWLIYTNEFFVGFLALVVSYWGNRIHRISWLGGLTIFYSVSAAIMIVPEFYRKTSDGQQLAGRDVLCSFNRTEMHRPEGLNHIAVALLITYQVFFAMTTIAFVALGITYLDDNISPKQSPIYIGIGFASRELGKQIGLYLAWIPFFKNSTTIFFSPMWICLTVLLFIAGIVISMFPKNLPSVLVERAAASILSLATGLDFRQQVGSTGGFFQVFIRLLKNRILVTNMFITVILQSALINFGIFEKSFNQTKFKIPMKNDYSGYYDPPLAQFTTNLLKQPLITISLITTGTVIAKTKPKARSLVVWNAGVLFVALLLFASTVFFKCTDELEDHKRKDSFYFCGLGCHCDFNFQPICLNGKTFFSPCIAGCLNINNINENYKMYQNCTCAGWDNRNSEASEGSCNSEKCTLLWGIFQVNSVISSAVLATLLITNFIINMRSILPEDKAVAIGLEATLIGLIPYLPVKFSYAYIADTMCQFKHQNVCKLYTRDLPIFLSLTTIVLMFISLLLEGILFWFTKDLQLYKRKKSKEEIQTPENTRLFNEPSNENEEHLNLSLDSVNSRKTNTNSRASMPDSLLELENVGDDHDSVDSVQVEKLTHLETEF